MFLPRFVYLDVSSYLKGDGEPTNTLIASGTIQNTSTKTLTDYFSKYGDCVAVRRSKENGSKFSRWAFVQFRDIESVDEVLADEEHVIKGEMVDCRRHLCAAPPKRCHANAAMNPQPIQSAVTSGDSVRVTKLCIHSLAIKTTTETMRKYFSKFGTIVDAYVPTYYGTDKSKGFGYIVMPSEEAYFNFSHHIIDGKAVSISKEAPSQDTEESSTLLVSAGPQIMMKITEEDLKKFFSRFGKILSVRMKTDPGTNKPSHYAFVQFTSCEPVEKALGESTKVLRLLSMKIYFLCFVLQPISHTKSTETSSALPNLVLTLTSKVISRTLTKTVQSTSAVLLFQTRKDSSHQNLYFSLRTFVDNFLNNFQ